MQYSLLLVSIAALAVSAPVDNQIAGDSKYIVYDPYASYSPYQGYPRAIEKEAAAGKRTVTESIMHDVATEAKPKTAMMHPGMKRHMANMPSPEEMHSKPGMATDAWYGGYEPYAKYGSYQYKGYGSEVDKEGEGTQMMKENE